MNRFIQLYKQFGGASLLREYLRTGFLFKAPLLLLCTGFSNKALELFREAARAETYRYLRRKYRRILTDDDTAEPPTPGETARKVWIFWWQGMANAPQLVQQCYASVGRQMAGWEVMLITRDNYRDYVDLPSFITDKLTSGAITLTHFSDILRVELLIRHGGLWLDATVLCTDGKLPPAILNSDLFVFQTQKPGSNGHTICMSSWCIWARQNSVILRTTRRLLYAYWQKNNRLLNYFLLHQFFTMACEYHRDEAKAIPPRTNEAPHLLLLHLFDTYNETLWDDWQRQSGLHKLSYKLPEEKLRLDNTFYKKVLGGNL